MLINSLVNKYHNDQIAHFYILSMNNIEDKDDYANKWIKEFCLKIAPKVHNKEDILTNLHEDIELITTDAKNYNSSGEEFQSFFKALRFKANELKRKIIFVKDAHKINEVLANKLLKTLERPPVEATIFFINPDGIKLLPTIESRAIKLRISENRRKYKDSVRPKSDFTSWSQDLLDQTKEIEALAQLETGERQLYDLIDAIKSGELNEDLVVAAILNWHRQTKQSAKNVEKLINALKNYEKEKVFHNSLQERMTVLIGKTILTQ
jgi:DNA polymerase III delta prime subunit